jgi:predicted dehydrogenase
MKSNHLSRRTFLGVSAAAGATLAAKTILLDPTPMSAQAVSANSRVRFGMIGIGMQGNGLLATSIQLPGVECAAACDLYDGRHTLAKEIVGPNLPTTRRYQDLLENKEIDCVIAAVPDHWHKQIVVDAVNAGKDVYCEKPMSHSPADGIEMVAAAQKSGRIVQVGSQRVSSVICAKTKELIAQGVLGDLMMVEATLGRNAPSGAWQYPPPPDLSPQNVDWNTWLGSAPKHAFDPLLFARWRCWKEYGTGVAGDLLVHLMSGFLYMMGLNEAPQRATATGGIFRWKDGRNMPDVHSTLFDFRGMPVYMRINLGTETQEGYRFMGSKGILDVNHTSVTYTAQLGVDTAPAWYTASFPKALREDFVSKWHAEHDAELAKNPTAETITYQGASYDDTKPHLWNFFEAVRTRKPVAEDAVFGHHAALACHMANESYFRKSAVYWDEGSKSIKS